MLDPVVVISPAFVPKAVLFAPVVAVFNASNPNAFLLFAVVFDDKALCPTAELLAPVVIAVPASLPITVLFDPVVIESPAFVPPIVFPEILLLVFEELLLFTTKFAVKVFPVIVALSTLAGPSAWIVTSPVTVPLLVKIGVFPVIVTVLAKVLLFRVEDAPLIITASSNELWLTFTPLAPALVVSVAVALKSPKVITVLSPSAEMLTAFSKLFSTVVN